MSPLSAQPNASVATGRSEPLDPLEPPTAESLTLRGRGPLENSTTLGDRFLHIRDAVVAMNPIAVQLRPDFVQTIATLGAGARQAGLQGARLAVDVARAREFARIADPAARFTLLGKLGIANSPFAVVTGALNSVKQSKAAIASVNTYWRTRTDEDRDKAIGSVSKISTTLVGIGANGAETFIVGNKLLSGYRAAKLALDATLPMADPRVARAAAWAATKHLLERGGAFTSVTSAIFRARAEALGVSKTALEELSRSATTTSMATAVRRAIIARSKQLGLSTTMALGTATHAATRESLMRAGHVAAEAALDAGAKAAGTRTAMSLARFIPGLNVGLAVLDTAQAYATLKDANASLGKKSAHVVMALAAWVTATNVPGVSQVGGLVSMAAAFTGALL